MGFDDVILELDNMISIYDMDRKDYKYVAGHGNGYALYDNGMSSLTAKPLLGGVEQCKYFEILRTEPSLSKKESIQLNIPFPEYAYKNVFYDYEKQKAYK